MNRRLWTGVVAGVLAAMVMLGVAGAAYHAGERHEVVTRAVGDGEVVRVIGGYGPYGGGFHPGFFLFPLFLILLVVLLVRGFRGGYRGGRHGGPGLHERFEEQHRRLHEAERAAAAGPAETGEA
jgi:hypothetical protein